MKNPEQCHKIICEIKNSWFLLMIVITNSITMVAPLNAGSCQAVSKHVVALCPRFLFSLRSKRKLRHCGNNMFGNSLTRASISLSNHCALISYDNHRKSAFFDVTTYYSYSARKDFCNNVGKKIEFIGIYRYRPIWNSKLWHQKKLICDDCRN